MYKWTNIAAEKITNNLVNKLYNSKKWTHIIWNQQQLAHYLPTSWDSWEEFLKYQNYSDFYEIPLIEELKNIDNRSLSLKSKEYGYSK